MKNIATSGQRRALVRRKLMKKRRQIKQTKDTPEKAYERAMTGV